VEENMRMTIKARRELRQLVEKAMQEFQGWGSEEQEEEEKKREVDEQPYTWPLTAAMMRNTRFHWCAL